MEKKKTIPDDDLQVYCAHLDQLQQDMTERFQDIILLKISNWVINPFLDIDYEETGVAEEELLSIKHAIELRLKFQISYKESALLRFEQRRGTPAFCYSERGTNFVGAQNELKGCLDRIDNEKNHESNPREG